MNTPDRRNNPDQARTDAAMSRWLKSRLPQAPPQPWFTKTVLHRLPDRSVRIFSLIEYALYIIGIAATPVAATAIIRGFDSAGDITIVQACELIMVAATFGCLLYALLRPFMCRTSKSR